MKRLAPFVLLALFLALVGGAFWFLWSKSQKPATQFSTEQAETRDIVRKTVATGAIVPRQEVEIKPRVSGVLESISVEPGQMITRDAPIAKIQIVPNAVNLNRAESEVRAAQLAVQNSKRELDRNQGLFAQGVISEAALAIWKNDYQSNRQKLDAASSNLQLVKEGATSAAGKNSNIVVTSTVDGMVIDVPVKEGFSVTESNNFNAGTTIAIVANMGDMIFQGQVDESEVGKIKEKMKLEIKIGALEKEQFEGELEYISPKGKEIDGAIQFEIKAAITRREDVFVRAGYSANADIVLEEARGVLAIREALVQFEGDAKFVEVEIGPQQFERRDVELGLSDGIYVEIKSGVTATDKIKLPGNAGPPGMAGDRKRPPGERPRRAR